MRRHLGRGRGNNHSDRDRDSNCNSAFYALRERIGLLAFRPFQSCVLVWLGAQGFGQLRSLGRLHRRGRRAQGGADFTATVPGSRVRVAIQIRHWRTPIQRRAVDEFWGFLLRTGIPAGLLVTNAQISRRAIQAAQEYPGRPIQLVSCTSLAQSMIALELGIRKHFDGSAVLDERFFNVLRMLRLASSADEPDHAPRVGRGPNSHLASPVMAQSPGGIPPLSWFLIAVALVAALAITISYLGGLR